MSGLLSLMPPLLLSIGGPVAIQGPSDCPSPEAVAALLPSLFTPSASTDGLVVVMESAGPNLAITLHDRDGSLRLTRQLPRPDLSPRACSALAEAVAVMIAAWQIEQNAELSLLQPGIGPPTAASTGVERFEPVQPPTITSSSLELFLGAAAGASLSASAVVETGQVEFGLRRAADRLGLSSSMTVDGQGQVNEGSGTSTWRRVTIGVGPWLALGRGIVAAELGLQLFLGRTSVDGRGFAVDRSDHATTLGSELLARIAGGGAVQPFLEAGFRAWFAPQEITVLDSNGSDSHASLPRVDGRVTVGVRFRIGT